VFGRDGGLSQVDVLSQRLVKRVMQAGNSIGGAISSDGRIVAAQNYQPGGVKLFDADTLELLAEVSTGGSKVVGLADLPGNRFAFSLFEAGEIWLIDASQPRAPQVTRYPNIGRQPYDGLASQDGRHYLAGLYGEDGLALLDTWQPERGVRRILDGYGRGHTALPVAAGNLVGAFGGVGFYRNGHHIGGRIVVDSLHAVIKKADMHVRRRQARQGGNGQRLHLPAANVRLAGAMPNGRVNQGQSHRFTRKRW